jgi:hypothetical protein
MILLAGHDLEFSIRILFRLGRRRPDAESVTQNSPG